MKPRIIIPQELALKIRSNVDGLQYCYGITRFDEELVQILSLQPQDDLKKVARIRPDGIELEDFQCSVPFAEVETIPVADEFVSRSQGVIDTGVIAGKKVAFVGLGSVGSQIALHLTQSSVTSFTLLDPDKFSASNLARHTCDMRDLHRYKTKAVRDMILRRNPHALTRTFEENLLDLAWHEQLERLQNSDLVIATTDSTAAQFMVNELCYSLQIPSIYVGCYERACSGEILFVVPGKTACFNCFMEFRQSYLSELKKKERRIPYSDSQAAEFKGEPGLAIDIAYIVAISSAYALALLLPDSHRNKILDFERNLALVHTGSPPQEHYAEIFHLPFDLLFARVKRDNECPVCQQSTGG
jgi:hypothetical protein